MTTRTAHVALHNATSARHTFRVLHQYTGDAIEIISDGHSLGPGATIPIGDVHYRTGWFTTGVDNWIVTADDNMGTHWTSGRGLFSFWKVHTLREEDANQTTTIVVSADKVTFLSRSGTSSTSWTRVLSPVPPPAPAPAPIDWTCRLL